MMTFNLVELRSLSWTW